MTAMLVLPLEMDLWEVVVSSGNFYPFFRGIDIILGLQGVMGLVEIRFLGAGVKRHVL